MTMEDDFVKRFLAIHIAERYQLVERLGEGTFGLVYLGRDTITGDQVAIKLEHNRIAPSLLDQEVRTYEALHGRPGFPEVFWYGFQDDYQVMVFELLGPNLEDLFQYCDRQFSMKTVSMVMDQLLRRLEHLHATGHHHRDIKPENFLMGTGRKGNLIYLTDLGLAVYRLPSIQRVSHGDSRPPPRPALIGTCRYASINGHLSVPSSCRDDLESLGYMAVYFLRGSLPWQGLSITDQVQKYERVLELKQQTSVDELCRGLPEEMVTYMTYLRELQDPDRPNYKYLRGLFGGNRRRWDHDNIFDWTVREFERLSACHSSGSKTGRQTSTRVKLQSGTTRQRRRKR